MAHVNPIQIQKYLKGVDYPASKAALLEKAKSLGADENVCASLEMLPDEDFQTPADVSQAFGELPGDAPAARKDEGRAQPRKQEARGGKEAKQDKGARQDKDERAAKPEAREHVAKARTVTRHTGSNEFLIQAMQDSMAEIRVCEIAIEKSQNPDVKAFAQSMIDEHGRMGRDMEQLAAQKKLDVPQEIRAEQEMTVDELSSLDGRDFEQRWIQYNIDVHERDIKIFNHYAGEEQDEEIRKMAQEGAKVFGKHLKMAHDVGKKLAKP
jgi:predicted outer membrane protein